MEDAKIIPDKPPLTKEQERAIVEAILRPRAGGQWINLTLGGDSWKRIAEVAISFSTTLDAICSWLLAGQNAANPEEFDGSYTQRPTKDHEALLAELVNNPQCRTILLNITLGKVDWHGMADNAGHLLISFDAFFSKLIEDRKTILTFGTGFPPQLEEVLLFHPPQIARKLAAR